MRLVTVKLESLAPGQEIVSDVHDSLGRLLLKAPQSLDESMKKILLSRGIVDVVIEDRRSSPRVEDSLAVERELEALNTRMSLFQSFGYLLYSIIGVLPRASIYNPCRGDLEKE